ncbi:uncharacterized endoplasmic reticulum membrane protein [[Candida] railenensis]|uniref:Uncharacterized endoplasmic reticulum membrane protein n=1 Tax=[Candida] railenensis TaxID=45579 RepID=A0A9P0QX63_9ASCO|nr:uncharacterized endoplasmic reticulum membrane protein [[Candida] railenensis]
MKDDCASVDPLDTSNNGTKIDQEEILQPTIGTFNTKNEIYGFDNLEKSAKKNVPSSSNGVDNTDDFVKEASSHSSRNENSDTSDDAKSEGRNTSQADDTSEKHKDKTLKGVAMTIWKDDGFHVVYLFGRVFVKISVCFLAIVGLYWGSMFDRPSRYKNLNTLVLSADSAFENANGTTIQPLVSDAFIDMVTNDPLVKSQLGWKVGSMEDFKKQASENNNTVEAEILKQVHHQQWWAAVYIKESSTQLIYDALASGNSSFANGTSAQLIDVIFEQGRHYSSLTQYVQKHLAAAEEQWVGFYTSEKIFKPLIGNLSAEQLTSLVNSSTSLPLLSSPPLFNYIDISKNLIASMLGPSQLGLIYAQIFSFHQFNFSLQMHQYLKGRLRLNHYIVYRLLASQVNYLVLSLVYALVTIAFRVPVSHVFGYSGFLVLWMFMFLFISACGGINENMVLLLFSYGKVSYIPIWMVVFVIVNISPTFSALDLCPRFYEYGYALPMFNVFEALRVVFFDTWKGALGRNIGVLVAWIVLTNIILLYTIKLGSIKEEKEKLAKSNAKDNEVKQ